MVPCSARNPTTPITTMTPRRYKPSGLFSTPCLDDKAPSNPFLLFFCMMDLFSVFYGMQSYLEQKKTSLSGRLDWRVFISHLFILVLVFSLLQVKLEPRSPAKPSRVVHIRNIPNDVTEAEIVHLGIPFGRVTNVLVLKGKNQVWFYCIYFSIELPLSFISFFFQQAFLEMAEEPAAISMVNYFSSGTSAQLRGRNVFVQYSNHTQLKTDQSHSNAVRAVTASTHFFITVMAWY